MPLLSFIFAFSYFSAEKANVFLLPCPFKYMTGYDCPGCGFQRSLLALFNGDFSESFHLYPPAIPLLLTFAISLTMNFWFRTKSKGVINTLSVITGVMIMISYIYKMWPLIY